MGADIENPDPDDGCVAAASEPSRRTPKEEGTRGATAADIAAAKPPYTWRSYASLVCCAVVFIAVVSLVAPHLRDRAYGYKDTKHLVVACVAFGVGVPLCLFLVVAAEIYRQP